MQSACYNISIMNKETIIKELLDKKLIEIGESIDYAKFCYVQKQSGYTNIKEYDFAQILGISNTNFRNIRDREQRAVVLKELIPQKEQKQREQVEKDLIGNKKVEPGERIDYQKFCNLHEDYSYIPEPVFARFLELTYDAVYNMKKDIPAIVFKSKYSEEEMVEKIIEEKLVTPGEKLNYIQFLERSELIKKHHPATRHFSEYAMAKLLGVRKGNFGSCKRHNTNIIILKQYIKRKKNYKVSEEERNQVVEELIKNKNARPYQYCDYERFLELYSGYEEKYSEKTFYEMLDLSYRDFYQIKNKKDKKRILRDCFSKEKVVEELLQSGKVTAGEEISLDKFNELHNEFNYFDRKLFAEILEITEGERENLEGRYTQKVQILRSKLPKKRILSGQEIKNEEKNQALKMLGELFQKGVIQYNQRIDYIEFKKLYSYLGKTRIPEHELAEMLGIPYFQYQNMRHMGKKIRIKNYKTLESIRIMGTLEKRFYSKEEIEEMLNKHNISLEEFMENVILKWIPEENIERYIELYSDTLERHKGIYIGKGRMSNSYFEMLYPRIEPAIYKLVGYICKSRGRLHVVEDCKSEALMYILERCGDIEQNFSDIDDGETAIRMILARAKWVIHYKALEEYRVNKKITSENRFYRRGNIRDYIEDKKDTVEKVVIEKIIGETTEAKIMCDLIIGNENGIEKGELFDMIYRKYNIGEEELLKLLEKRLIHKRERAEQEKKAI